MKHKLLILLSAALLPHLCGCGLISAPKPRNTTFSVLRSIRETPSVCGLTAGRITNTSGTTYKMRYRQGTAVIVDEYRQWADMPQILTANILRLDFTSGDNVLSANIFCWETNVDAMQIRFGAEWQIDSRGRLQKSIYTCPLTELSQNAIAEAFSTAVNLWEQDIEAFLASVPADPAE